MYALTRPKGEDIDPYTAAEALGADTEAVTSIVKELGEDGLLEDDQRLAGLTLDLNAIGQRKAQAWAALAQKRAKREVACRDALLDWLYEQSGRQSHWGHGAPIRVATSTACSSPTRKLTQPAKP
jgi:hypothetical protein